MTSENSLVSMEPTNPTPEGATPTGDVHVPPELLAHRQAFGYDTPLAERTPEEAATLVGDDPRTLRRLDSQQNTSLFS